MQEAQERWVWSLGQENFLEKSTATHSSVLAWRIPWIEEPSRLQYTGSQRVRHDWSSLVCMHVIYSIRCLIKECRIVCLHHTNTHTYTYTHTKLWMGHWFLCVPYAAAAAAKSLQSSPTLCDPIDGSPRGSPVPGILQARTLEWVAISFSNAWKWEVKVKSLSRVRLLATPWTAAHQVPPSMGFSRQEYWSGVPLPSPCVPYSI